MQLTLPHYESRDEDNILWDGFKFRFGDIVVSARAKSGTTWMQQLCALLIFRGPDFPAPLHVMSPWVDHKGTSGRARAVLEAQPHRRVMKTHTPLDGVPRALGVSYIVVARDPLDATVSLYHHLRNLREHGRLPGSVQQFIREFVTARGFFEGRGLPQVLRGIRAAWEQRGEGDVHLARYEDMLSGLPEEVRRLAGFLEVKLGDGEAERLAEHATFGAMRTAADVPLPGLFRDTRKFYRGGRAGDARRCCNPQDYARGIEVIRRCLPEDCAGWLLGGDA